MLAGMSRYLLSYVLMALASCATTDASRLEAKRVELADAAAARGDHGAAAANYFAAGAGQTGAARAELDGKRAEQAGLWIHDEVATANTKMVAGDVKGALGIAVSLFRSTLGPEFDRVDVSAAASLRTALVESWLRDQLAAVGADERAGHLAEAYLRTRAIDQVARGSLYLDAAWIARDRAGRARCTAHVGERADRPGARRSCGRSRCRSRGPRGTRRVPVPAPPRRGSRGRRCPRCGGSRAGGHAQARGDAHGRRSPRLARGAPTCRGARGRAAGESPVRARLARVEVAIAATFTQLAEQASDTLGAQYLRWQLASRYGAAKDAAGRRTARAGSTYSPRSTGISLPPARPATR